jgi:hypothetical protein
VAHALAAAVEEFTQHIAPGAAFDQFQAQAAEAAQRRRPVIDPAQLELADAEHLGVGLHRRFEIADHHAEALEAAQGQAHAGRPPSRRVSRMACSAASAALPCTKRRRLSCDLRAFMFSSSVIVRLRKR